MDYAFSIKLIKYNGQYEVRQRRPTGDVMPCVSQIESYTIENYRKSRTVALDMSKVFDRGWYHNLLNTLSYYALSGEL